MHGIILRAYPSGDSDLVLRVLTEERGKISVFARAARRSKKRFNAIPEPLDLGRFELSPARGDLYGLKSYFPQTSFPDLRNSLNKLSLASFVCESCDALLVEDDSHKSFYEALKEHLRLIDQSPNLRETFRHAYACVEDLLGYTGYLSLEEREVPSWNQLVKKIKLIEEISEKQLLSKTILPDILKELKTEQSAA